MSVYAALFALLTFAFACGLFAMVYSPTLGAFEIGFGAVCAALSIYTAASGLTLLGDAMRPGPALIIGADGLVDRRQKFRVLWNDVVCAEIRPGRIGMANVALRTHDGRTVRSTPFRVGAHRRSGDQIVIPLQFLHPPPSVSAVTISAFVERARVVRQKPLSTNDAVFPRYGGNVTRRP